MICTDIPVAPGDRVLLFSCAWPPDGYEGVVETCDATRWESYGHAVTVRVDDTRVEPWQRGALAKHTDLHGQARAYPAWTRRLFVALAAARDLAQRNAATASALRSALPGEQVAEELRALRALIVKGGAQ